MLDRAEIEEYENINIDNYAEVDKFFSYRRTKLAGGKDYGRSLSGIKIKS